MIQEGAEVLSLFTAGIVLKAHWHLFVDRLWSWSSTWHIGETVRVTDCCIIS